MAKIDETAQFVGQPSMRFIKTTANPLKTPFGKRPAMGALTLDGENVIEVSDGIIDPQVISFLEPPSNTENVFAENAYANYKRLIARAVEVFGDEVEASIWLSTPSPDFEDKPPLQVAQEHGYDPRVLEQVLIRIEHGVYF